MLYGTYTFIGKQIGKKGEWVGGEPRWLQLHIFIFFNFKLGQTDRERLVYE